MNKKYIIQKNEEIAKIVKTGIKEFSKCFIIYSIESNLDYSKFCISVSRKIGKAHVRPRYGQGCSRRCRC